MSKSRVLTRRAWNTRTTVYSDPVSTDSETRRKIPIMQVGRNSDRACRTRGVPIRCRDFHESCGFFLQPVEIGSSVGMACPAFLYSPGNRFQCTIGAERKMLFCAVPRRTPAIRFVFILIFLSFYVDRTLLSVVVVGVCVGGGMICLHLFTLTHLISSLNLF